MNDSVAKTRRALANLATAGVGLAFLLMGASHVTAQQQPILF